MDLLDFCSVQRALQFRPGLTMGHLPNTAGNHCDAVGYGQDARKCVTSIRRLQ